MKIFYFSFTRFPSEKAHSLYIAKSCEALESISDTDVKVVVPRRFMTAKESPRTFYGLNLDLKVVKLPCVDLFPFFMFKKIAIYVGLSTFSLSSLLYSLLKIRKKDIIITNDALVALVLSFVHNKVIYELHDYPQGSLWLYRRLFKSVYLIQTNNLQKKTLLGKQFSVPAEKMFSAHNGVTVKDFDLKLSREEAREKLGLDVSEKIVVYTGHLYDWKGADILANTAIRMPETVFIFIGGSADDVEEMKSKYSKYKNIIFLGFRPHKDMPVYQRAADVLVVPNTAKKDISRLHTSPMKIFEYMASRTPIVASNIPSVREILNNDNSIMFDPDSVPSLVNSLRRALFLSSEQSSRLVDKAFFDVQAHSWTRRALEILSKIDRE